MTAALSRFQHQVPEIFFCSYIIFLKPGGAVLATMIKLCLVPVMRAARNSRLSGRQNKLRFIQIGKINNAPHGGAGGAVRSGSRPLPPAVVWVSPSSTRPGVPRGRRLISSLSYRPHPRDKQGRSPIHVLLVQHFRSPT